MKYFLISLGFFITSIQANAIPTEQAIELCRAEQNALKRLLCYDAINVETTAGTSLTPNQATLSKPQLTNSQPKTNTNTDSNFGIEHKQKEKQDTDLINVTVKAISFTAREELQVEFENGQKWRQQGNDYYPIAIGEQHSIKRGIFNSFVLSNDKNNRSIKIQREQ